MHHPYSGGSEICAVCRRNKNWFTKRPIVSAEAQLAGLLAAAEPAAKSPRNPPGERSLAFEFDQQLSTAELHAGGLAADVLCRPCVVELDERVTSRETGHHVADQMNSADRRELGERALDGGLRRGSVESPDEQRALGIADDAPVRPIIGRQSANDGAVVRHYVGTVNAAAANRVVLPRERRPTVGHRHS